MSATKINFGLDVILGAAFVLALTSGLAAESIHSRMEFHLFASLLFMFFAFAVQCWRRASEPDPQVRPTWTSKGKIMEIRFELQPVSQSTVAVIDPQLASNAAAIILDNYIVAVDATMRPDTSRTFRMLLEEKYRRPVKYLCVTHYHGDHVLGLKSFKDVTLFASAHIVANMKVRMNSDWTPEGLAAWKAEDPAVAEWINDVEIIIPPMLIHQRLDIADHAKVIEFYQAGGHTSCSIFGYYPAEKILFAGDLIFAGQMPFAGDASCDPEQWMATLKTWLNWEIDKVIPGHGPLTDKREIRKQLEFFEALKCATLDALAAGKGPQDIVMPPRYTVEPKEQWLLERTQQRWHEYYRQGREDG